MKSRYLLLAALLSVATLAHSQVANRYTITILGEVPKPGRYEFNAERTVSLLQVYAMAQGATRDANLRTVEIIRAPKVNAAGVSIPSAIIEVDLRRILARQADDIQLEPGDVINVPANKAKGSGKGLLIAGISN